MTFARKMDCSVLPFTTMLEMKPSGENVLNAAIVRAVPLRAQNDPRSKFRTIACKEQARRLSAASTFSTTNWSKQAASRRACDTPRSASAGCEISLIGDKAKPLIQIGHDEGCPGQRKYALKVVGVFGLFSAPDRHRTRRHGQHLTGPPNARLFRHNMLINREKNCVYELFIR
jgi:hypothetical protein